MSVPAEQLPASPADSIRAALHAHAATCQRLEKLREAMKKAEAAELDARRALAEVAGQGVLVFAGELLTIITQPGKAPLINRQAVRVLA